MKTALFVLLFASLTGSVLGAAQSVHIIGRLLCRNAPEQFAEVRVWHNRPVLSDPEMGHAMYTDGAGFFDFSGSLNQKTVDPYVYIYHRCYEKPYEIKGMCRNMFRLQVPQIFVSDGELPTKTWDMKEVHLEGENARTTDDEGC